MKLPAGEHVLRFTVTGDWLDIDYITFVEGKDATDPEPIGTISLRETVHLNAMSSNTFRVFDLKGALVGTVDLEGCKVQDALRSAGFSQGVYMLRSVRGNKKFMARVAE